MIGIRFCKWYDLEEATGRYTQLAHEKIMQALIGFNKVERVKEAGVKHFN